MLTEKRKDFTLVVRLWQVESGEDELTWRGSIERVPDREGGQVYFQTLKGLFNMIEEISETRED